MTAILDQKHYIEELNRHLSGTVTDLQAKMDSLEKTNSKLVEEVKRTVCTLVFVVNPSDSRGCVCVCFFFFSSSADGSDRPNQLSEGRTGTAKKAERVDLAVQPEKGRGQEADSHSTTPWL